VAIVDGEVVGDLSIWTFPTHWRRRHVGQIGMAVRDDWLRGEYIQAFSEARSSYTSRLDSPPY
jgi:hypothetical protein